MNGPEFLASDGESLVLCQRGDLWVDADAFKVAATTARRAREPAAYKAAIDLYAGDLLPEDRYEAWAEDRREQLRHLYLAMLIGLAKLHEERDEYGPAIDALRKATDEEPTVEQAYAALMRLYALSGKPEQALTQYDRLRSVLSRILGTQPAKATLRLHDEIATGGFPPPESLALSRQTGDTEGVVASLRLLAAVAIQDREDYGRATKLYEEGIALCRECGYMGELAQYLADMAEGYMHRGDFQRAKVLLEEAAALIREKGNGTFLEFVLEIQGWVTLLRGEHEQAKAFHEEGLALCRQVDNTFIAISNLEGLACIAAARGEDERAARIFGAAQKLHETVGDYNTPAEQALREPYLTDVRSRLNEASWAAAFTEGRVKTFEEVVDYALSAEGSYPSTTFTALALPTDELADDLTRREREVTLLVARGLTNRQISAELSISERTAANHVAKILRKLGLRSRAQIAAAAEARSEIATGTVTSDE
jgi:DNA-binding SARP family transcriptional activator/DNA-binding CsgD family transcriptional regulator